MTCAVVVYRPMAKKVAWKLVAKISEYSELGFWAETCSTSPARVVCKSVAEVTIHIYIYIS